jgi:1-acyl-sn-glycerol-3-phosphate acyltransferase
MRARAGSPARRGAAVAADFARVWVVARMVAPRVAPVERRRLAQRLASGTLYALGIDLSVRGAGPHAATPALVVANHVSWLDVQALGTLGPMRFVAKSETRRWPVAGAIARGFDTFFLRRWHFRDAARVKDAVAAALRAGETVAVFPEGTTTDGTRLGRFHHAFFQAAIDAGVPVLPVAIRYVDGNGGPSVAVRFVGDDTFVGSLVRVVRAPSLGAELRVMRPIPSGGRTRRQLAAAAQAMIAGALALPPEAVDRPARRPPRRRRAA